MSYHRLPTAPLASRHRRAGGGAVDNRTPQGSTYFHPISVQSNGATSLEQVGANHWHMVIIDECHHLPAESFKRFATAVRPRYLLGLTATPERSDGAPIKQLSAADVN
jgi:superfamily II DNA or RNA helicase